MDTQPIPTNNIVPPPPKPPTPGVPKKALWIIVILMLLAIALSAWYWQITRPVIQNQPVVKEGLPQGYEFKALPRGQYPEGFPQELALSVGQMEVVRAEDTIVASGQNQKIVDIRTTDQPDSLAGLYRNTLTDPKQGWQLITSETTDNITALVFKKDTASFIVTIIPKDSGSQINLTYVAGKQN